MTKIIAILIIVIIILLCWCNRRGETETHLRGIWCATPTFCEKSGVESMVLWIDDTTLVIINGIDTKINLSYSMPWFIYSPHATICATTDFELWPHDITLRLNMTTDTLAIVHDGDSYGYFYKDHLIEHEKVCCADVKDDASLHSTEFSED